MTRELSPVKKARRADAEQRQANYDKLTTQEKIAKLDRNFGVGVGAVKERARLQAALAKEMAEQAATDKPEETSSKPVKTKRVKKDS